MSAHGALDDGRGLPSGRVLVVEDNEINLTVITRMLNRLGCETDVARNGQEALEAWRENQYQLIMMDCEMPIMNGYEATTAIREEQGEAAPQIVATTAYASGLHRVRCKHAGMDVFVAKPMTLAKLRDAMDKCQALRAEDELVRGVPPQLLAG